MRDPARRFATAHELALALEAARGRRESIASSGALADWLRGLFPDLYARRLELVDQARQMVESTVPRVSRALSEPELDTRPLPESLPSTHARRWWSRRGKGSSLAFALLALLLAAAGFWLLRTPRALHEAAPREASETARASAPPSPALPHPPEPTIAAADQPVTEPQTVVTSAPQAAAAAQAPVHALSRGVVNVATPGGWADVFVAGHHRGRTPLQLELPQGRRTLVLKPFGAKPLKREVVVRPGQVTRLVVHVHASPESVHAAE
jgi:hypothetical protein